MIKNFEELSYERKVDVLVAIFVMGINPLAITIQDYNSHILVTYLPAEGPAVVIPCYSTLLTSAWDLVRKFKYLYLFHCETFKEGQWEAKLIDEHSRGGSYITDVYYAWAENEMIAICYAGLKAVGYDLKSFLKLEKKI